MVAAAGNTLLSLAQRLRGPTRAARIGLVDLGVAIGLAGFTLAGNHLAAVAVQEMSPSMMNLLLRSELPLTALAAWIVLGERVERRFWVGTVIAMGGLVLLQGAPAGEVGAIPLGPGPYTEDQQNRAGDIFYGAEKIGLEHFSQRLSAANVMHGAAEGLKAINRAAKDRIARKRRSDHGV